MAQADGVAEFVEESSGNDVGALAHVLIWCSFPEAESDSRVRAAKI